MSYGRLSHEQASVLRPLIEGRTVHDLGAGDCELAVFLLERLGASCVVAIDKDVMPQVERPGLIQARSTFSDIVDGRSLEGRWGAEEIVRARNLTQSIDVAFLSWPANRVDHGLFELVKRAALVVYLGKNTDGSACAWPGLFAFELIYREDLAHVPERQNTLLVYGMRLDGPRRPHGEEIAAITAWQPSTKIMRFEDVLKLG